MFFFGFCIYQKRKETMKNDKIVYRLFFFKKRFLLVLGIFVGFPNLRPRIS